MPSLVLTPAGSQIINTKLKKLTDLSAKLATMRVTINKVLKRLQVRNCQMRLWGSLARGQGIRFCCYNPPELLWEESLTFLQEANDTGRALGGPLTAQQLLLCAGRIEQCNAVQLEQLLNDMDLFEEEEDEERGDINNGRFCSLVDQLLSGHGYSRELV